VACLSGTFAASISQQTPVPQPTPDRLAIPVLPPNPSQADLGLQVYYYHCMPCHGDKGQGLTDEWRKVWVEDHQNCWARGCHAGRQGDEGFPLPGYIPGVHDLSRFSNPQDLFIYLKTTHPPQKPGTLKEDEYRHVTAFLLQQADRLTNGEMMGKSTSPRDSLSGIFSLLAITGATLILSLALIFQRRKP